MRGNVEKARAVPFALTAGGVAYVECDADALYLSEGPTATGELYVQLDDDGPEFTLAQSFFVRAWAFRRMRLRNASGAGISGTLFLSRDPEFFVHAPGSGGGGGGTGDVGLDLRGVNARFYPFSVILPASGSGGSSSTLRHPVVEMDTGATVAASKTRQAVEEFNARAMFFNGTQNFWSYRQRVRARVLVYTATNGGDDNSQAGIQIGLAVAHPLTAQRFIRLALTLETGLYAFKLYTSDGVGLTKTTLTGVASPALNRGYQLEFEYFPGDRVDAYVDGVLGASVTSTIPGGAVAQSRAAGIFVGEDASSLDRVAAAFSNLEAYTYVV